jgi:hypothetical protein
VHEAFCNDYSRGMSGGAPVWFKTSDPFPKDKKKEEDKTN